ncbi:general stress protein CsbD [Methylotenera sp.]|jgi:uncharacterized protein YjbJ (UPF0337 family)|uniref:General stress protein CsbD n=1 Tax=Methylotenera mobilis TaxID=359408 RepID=A0A351R9L5_9PROT|nr:general stress protein CsbD [Methylotenera sp.]MDP3776316.1 general stress protein CsbD [Methylotenera sp.]HBA08736.1 general stress protein CsbD [Methylotenera mobilis]
MNWDRIDGDSKHFKGNAKDYLNETDELTDYSAGRRDYLSTKKQEIHGMSKDEAEGRLFSWQDIKKGKSHMNKPKNKTVKHTK